MKILDEMSILACQVNISNTPTAADRDQHLSRMCESVSTALSYEHSDLVVLPELSSIDYSREAFAQLDNLAEFLDGSSFEQWRTISTTFNCHVAFSFARKDTKGIYRITVAVVGPDGQLVGHYDKIYLAQFGASMEKEYFSPGRELFSFSIGGFRVGTIICADIRYPELCRSLAIDHGADIIVHPGAYARDPSFYSWHSFAHTRALENQIYFVSVNRAGAEYGRSVIVPPWIDDSVKPDIFHDSDEQLTRVIIKRSELAHTRSLYPFLRDRIEL